MTVQDLTDLIRASAPIVAAFGAMWAVWIGRTVHALVNSAMTAVKADLALANERITALQALVNALTAGMERRGPMTAVIPPALMVPPPLPPTVAKAP